MAKHTQSTTAAAKAKAEEAAKTDARATANQSHDAGKAAQQQAGAAKAAEADRASAAHADKSDDGGKSPRVPEIGEQTAKPPESTFDPEGNPADHVTTSRSTGMGSTQSTTGNPNSPSRVQGDSVTATASEVQAIADRNKAQQEDEKAAEKSRAKKAASEPTIGEDGRYKIASGPGNTFPLIVNGMTRNMTVGKSYDLSKNDFEIITNAGYTLELDE